MNKRLKTILTIVALVLGILLMIGITQYDLLARLVLDLVAKLKSGT